MKAWIAMEGGDHEGLYNVNGPYHVFFNKDWAEVERDAIEKAGPSYGYASLVELDLPDSYHP